jgi:hypothetical protein
MDYLIIYLLKNATKVQIILELTYGKEKKRKKKTEKQPLWAVF